MNIRDIARISKVSVATVSRALDPRKQSLVHPETRERLERVIRRHHYVPNRIAQALSNQSTNTVGMVTPFSTDVVKSPYFEGLIAGIIEGIYPLHYDLKWIMIRNEELQRYDSKTFLQKHSVDGVIFLSWRLFPHLVREIEHSANLPVVLINDYAKNICSSITYCENQSGVQQICSHFALRGYKKIGMLRGPEYISHDAHDRFLAFKRCLKEFGLQTKKSWLCESPRFEEETGYQCMLDWIQKKDLPQAIFCANDELGRGAIRALKQNKIRIPQQIAIAGFDDSEKNEMITPSLTSVRQPLELMGKAAMETLAKLLSKKAKTPIQLRFEPKLMVRGST